MTNKISQKITEWQKNSPDGPFYNDINAFINFRTKESFDSYIPTSGSHAKFEKRLEIWLDNLANANDQRKLFELVPNLYFFGAQEFNALYRASFREIILNWLIELYSIDLTKNDLHEKLSIAIGETWFCSVTDSMNISDFCHINEIHGQSDRPTWRSLAEFGDMSKINDYIERNNIKNIVLLEDFVGSGSQFLGEDEQYKGKRTILDCLLSLKNENSTLILPLISCPEGIENIINAVASKKCTWIKCNASLILTDICFIREDISKQDTLQIMDQREKDEFLLMHSLIHKIGEQYDFKYGSFGYNGTGSLIVMYTNCSDNTLSIIHEKTQNWSPLFLRINRIS
jgi:hypothetical protein